MENIMNVGTIVEYVGIDRMSTEDHRNRSYPLAKGLRGQVLRKAGTDFLVRWDNGTAQFVEWHRKTNIQAI
jgi:hypothetical protein